MPYLFAVLVLANVAFFGYLWFQPPKPDMQSVEQARAQLKAPIQYVNSSADIPAPIGEKK